LKIAVSAIKDSIDSQIDPRFGRCQYFLIVDSDTMNVEALTNMSQTSPSGAGIQAAQTVANKGSALVITGGIGLNASQVLTSAGIEIITGVSGTVREAIEKFKNGQFQNTTFTPTTVMGSGMGGSYGRGIGQGRGMGRVRGIGFRRWQTTSSYVPSQTDSPLNQSTLTAMSKKQEIEILENQMNILQQQLNQIKKRLKEISQ
jgi:predicted Fe-Mo cluster-binding NifX family protein